MIQLYNTASRSVDQFTPQNDTVVSLYSCGPTVYDHPHVGNWASYIRWDILARTLRQSYELNWYMNITDVGHLVSDADDGEDKLEKGARREGKSAWDVAEFYTQVFLDGLSALNISIDTNHLTKATDHIAEQINLIKALEAKGHTYIIDDGVYFDSSTFADYGKMARLDLEGLQAGARVDIGQKRHVSDFALWKFSPKDQQRDMEWDSPWGKGFPGWHIECSAMSMKYLGETIDIHTGGIDHIPVHHTNEIAQSEAVTGQPFVRFWLHSNFLQVDGQKISKSLENGFTLNDLKDREFDPQDLRMLVLQSHFQTEANFTWDGLSSAKNRRRELQALADLRFQFTETGQDISNELNQATNDLSEALNANLNTPKALAVISQVTSLVASQPLNSSNKESFMNFVSAVVDLLGFSELLEAVDITYEQKQLINQRTDARNAKDWALSDSIREQLVVQGITVNDSANGTTWSR
jgi:cysteinyl-tRNA synthetase